MNSNLYNKVVLKSASNTDQNMTQMYRGFSTLSPDTENFALYDFQLIKQDLLNHFYTRQGERLMQPDFGTVIWDLLFEPLTDNLKNIILQNVQQILNNDPRIRAEQVIVTQYESGIQLECKLTYLNYNLSQTLKLRFDQANGLLTA